MENLVPLGTGNSRLMKSNIPSNTTLAQLIQMWNNGTFPYDIGPLNSAGISQQGTPLNKDTLLKDATAALFGLGSDAVPDDMFNALAHTGDLHVWKRTQNGVVDYPVSPNRNAYQEGSNEQPAGYTLGSVSTGQFRLMADRYNSGSGIVAYAYDNKLVLNENGEITNLTKNDTKVAFSDSSGASGVKACQVLKGKFIRLIQDTTNPLKGDFPMDKVYFIPSSASILGYGSYGHPYASQRQSVTTHPAIPANTSIEYLGQLGNKVPIATGSYTGDGAGSRKISLGFTPKAVLLAGKGTLIDPSFYNFYGGLAITDSGADAYDNQSVLDIQTDGFKVRQTGSAHANEQGTYYNYIAFY